MRTLQDQIAREQSKTDNKDKEGNKVLNKARDELDGIVAAECLLCGDAMIRSVDRVFIRADDEAVAWAV